MLKSSLDVWYEGTVNLQGAELDFCWRKARSIHAFRNGCPSSLPDSSFRISTPSCGTPKLVGDNLIWIDQDRRQVHVLNMRLWTSRVFNGAARDMIYNVHVSNEVVAFSVLNGTIYVGDLNGQGPLKKFRLPRSTQRLLITCRHRTVACAQYLTDSSILVYIWNYNTQQGRSFIVNKETPTCSGYQLDSVKASQIGLLLQPDTETIVLFLFNFPTSESLHSCPQVTFYRFNYAGICLHGAKQVFDGYDNSTVESGDSGSMSFIPASHDALFMVQNNAWRLAPFVKTVHTLYFDENLHSFISPGHPRLDTVDPNDQGNVVWWKDTFIEAGTKEHIVVHRGTISNPRQDPDVAYNRLEPVRFEQKDFKDLLINDTYIVRPYCGAFYVYCYDHTVQLPGKEGTLNSVGRWEVIEPRFASVSDCVEKMHDM